jgi:hypothetical protein
VREEGIREKAKNSEGISARASKMSFQKCTLISSQTPRHDRKTEGMGKFTL